MLYLFIGTLLITAKFFVTDAASNSSESIFFRLYNKNNSFLDVHNGDADQIPSYLTEDEDLVVYIHGFMESVEKDGPELISQAYLAHTNHNIIAADYREIAALSYPEAVSLHCYVAGFIADVLNIIFFSGINITKVHIIGHSLGAQVAGCAARQTNFTVDRVTGLDPAGPLFYVIDRHLSKTDAAFVDIIHTDMGLYGIAEATGHVDFYPNSGCRPQPGCHLFGFILTEKELCSHHRSYKFYADSILNNNYVAVNCASELEVLTATCNQSDVTVMGYGTPSNVRGKYYLKTSADVSYGEGSDGIQSFTSSNSTA